MEKLEMHSAASPAQILRADRPRRKRYKYGFKEANGPHRTVSPFTSQSPPANQSPISSSPDLLLSDLDLPPDEKITSTDDIMVYQAESAAQRGPIPSLAARRRMAKMAELSIQTAGGGGDADYWRQQLQPARVEETDKDNKDGYLSPNCTTPPPLIFD